MTRIPNSPNWVDFFDELKYYPELWNRECDVFGDNDLKMKSWPKLLEVYRKIHPDANVDNLKKRLSCIRSCYLRELRKVKQMRKSGILYVPHLWYFEELDYLREREERLKAGKKKPKVGKEKPEAEEEQLEPQEENLEAQSFLLEFDDPEIIIEEPQPEPVEKKTPLFPLATLTKRRSIGEIEQITPISSGKTIVNEGMRPVEKTKEAEVDRSIGEDANIFSESWAALFKKLSPTQQIFAKKAIEDILVLGQLNLLTLNCVNVSTY